MMNTTTESISDRINKFIETWNMNNVEYTAKHFKNLKPETMTRTDGKKYVRLIRGGSCYGFVEMATGNILKAASWAAPAKGVRGSVMDYDFGISCSGPYGIQYLRGGSVGW